MKKNSHIWLVALAFVILFCFGLYWSISDNDVETHTHVCYGFLDSVFTDGTMASIDFNNGSTPGITFYSSFNEAYSPFDFELLTIGCEYTFVYHLEDNTPRPGIDMYYIDYAPVIDEINRGNHLDYWVNVTGCELEQPVIGKHREKDIP